MGAGWAGGQPETAELRLSDGRVVSVRFRGGAGLGFRPWPGTFALAEFLDERREELRLQELEALELGSGACSICGLAAGLLCRRATLSDRPEVARELYLLAQRHGLQDRVSVKVLDWTDLDFVEREQRPGAADLILMADVVYFPTLWRPLLHTLLLLASGSTLVLWANCDRYPHYTPDLAAFLGLLAPFFEVRLERELPQEGRPGASGGGRVLVRSLRLRDEEAAREELERARGGCVRRCLG